MHHSATTEFEPATVWSRDVELCGWFGERKIARTQAGLDLVAEEGVYEALDGASKITKTCLLYTSDAADE